MIKTSSLIIKTVPKMDKSRQTVQGLQCSICIVWMNCLMVKSHWSTFRIITANEQPRDKTKKWHVHPTKTQISLGIRPVWSECWLSAWRKLGSLTTHWAHSKDSDQTGRMPRLIWLFSGCTSVCWFCHEAAQIFQVSKFLWYTFWNFAKGVLYSSVLHFYQTQDHYAWS